MEDTDRTPASGAEHNPATITQLADDIISRMQSERVAPTLGVLVAILQELRERIPDMFDEQILLLKSMRRSCARLLKKSGRVGFVYELEKITGYLEQIGELPAHSFGLVIERIPEGDPYAASSYLEGVRGLADKARSTSAVRRLIALLGDLDDRTSPLAWSDREWKRFEAVVERHEATLAGLLGIAPVVREDPSAAGYQLDAAAAPAKASVGKEGGTFRWKSTLVLLVYFADLFRKTGLIDPTMTDTEIIACCEYGSRASDPVTVFQKTRSKMKNKEGHPNHSMLMKIIKLMLKPLKVDERKEIVGWIADMNRQGEE